MSLQLLYCHCLLFLTVRSTSVHAPNSSVVAFQPSVNVVRPSRSSGAIRSSAKPTPFRHALPTGYERTKSKSEQCLLPTTEAESFAIDESNIWEQAALLIVNVKNDPSRMPAFVQCVSLLRVGVPSLALATLAKFAYPFAALQIAAWINNDDGVFAVVAQDASQYIQNILTTSGLVFSLLVGQTYYFMYQQQEKIYLALFEEVTMAKSLLEQVALVCQGRESLYQRIIECIHRYVSQDLTRFNDRDPAVMLSERPVDDPLEDILFLTSVGEPSIVYQTVRSLRQARASRLGALQRKLPSIHMFLLWTLAAIVLFTFPLLGAGSQTIGGSGILEVQSWYLAFIVFGINLTLGVIYELRRPGQTGAYNARAVLSVMVSGLEQELEQRRSGELGLASSVFWGGPSVDSDGSFDANLLSESGSWTKR